MEGNDPGVEIQIADCRWLFCNSIYIISIPHVMMGNFPIPTARANLKIKMHTMRIEKRHLIYIGVIFKVQPIFNTGSIFLSISDPILREVWLILVKYWYQFIIALLSSRSKADWTFVRGRIALGLLSVKFIGNWQSEKFTGGSYDIIELTFCCSFL